MPDRDCEWEDALGDAGADFGDGLPAVAFEVGLGSEHRVWTPFAPITPAAPLGIIHLDAGHIEERCWHSRPRSEAESSHVAVTNQACDAVDSDEVQRLEGKRQLRLDDPTARQHTEP